MGPELDYAFLAEYAAVSPHGTLTSVGASFTRVTYTSFPAQQLIAVAGRIRMPAERGEPVPLTIVIEGPSREGSDHPEVRLQMEAVLSPEGAEPYDGKIGLLFATNTLYPVLGPGVHTVTLSLVGEPVRVLKYEAVLAPTKQ